MKLSEMQKVLKKYEDLYGDVEINVHHKEYDTDIPMEFVSFSVITTKDEEPYNVKRISLWV